VRKHLTAIVGPLLGIGLIILVCWVLAHKLRAIRPEDVQRAMLNTPAWRIIVAFLLTAAYYTIITGYDFVAFRIIGHPLPYRRIGPASFIAYTLGHNIGLSALTGGSIRFRIYSAFGLSSAEVAKVLVFTTLSFWVGFLTVASTVFLLLPIRVPPVLHLPFRSAWPIGGIAVILLATYCWLSTHTRDGLRIGGFTIPHLSPATILRQMLVGGGEWLTGSLVVFTLLSKNLGVIHFGRFFQIFVLAQFAGLGSQLPGGIGVFESVILLLLPPNANVGVVIGVLLVYRIIFYIVPFLIAALSFLLHEIHFGKQQLRKLRRANQETICVSSSRMPNEPGK
jgi:uncharacterized membrane protein YbhN (UPF0104 family)